MSDNSAGNWCLIESDPGVFTELIKEFGKKKQIFKFSTVNENFEVMLFVFYLGCEGVQVEELWSLDAEQFKDLE